MERQRRNLYAAIDGEFKKLLFHWQADPDSSNIVERFGSTVERAAHIGAGLDITIKEETFGTREGRNSISALDLKRFAKYDGDGYVFRFNPKRTPEGNIRVGVRDLLAADSNRGIIDKYNLVFESRTDSGWRVFAVFRPHEIASLKLH